MSLGTWFRDYVYIPLGGNRVSKPRWLFNIFAVWFLTGFWHGASWNFIVWGLYFAVILMLEKLILLPILEKSGPLKHVYVMLLVIISFVIFNAADMTEAFAYIGGMFGAGGVPVASAEAVYYFKSNLVVLLIAVVGATPFCKNFVAKIRENKTGALILEVLEPMVLVGLMLLVTAYLVDGSFNPFLYFRF